MTFASDLKRFSHKVEARNLSVFAATVAEAKTSIVEGSAITGAPGQPVDTGSLRMSWSVVFESPSVALIGTNLDYARHVEENVRGVVFRNHGPHSCALTIAGIGRIVENELRKMGDR